jgi:prepilin-type N-terminal cleavage/methylation domain-containing protein
MKLSANSYQLTATRRGFTMIEMAVSMSIIAIVLVALGSVVVLSSRALDATNNGSAMQSAQARGIVDQLASDMKMAIAFSEHTSNAVTFTVPDRNGDSQPETIRYAWSGQGTALTRTYTSGTFSSTGTLASNVYGFNLAWMNKSVGPPAPPPPTESPEQVLIFHNGAAGSNIKAFGIKSSTWPAEYFKPTLPANTVSWKITKLKLMLARNGAAIGNLAVQIRPVDAAQKPTTTVSATSQVNVLLLSTTAGYVDVPISLANLDPSKGYCVVITTAISGTPAYASYDSASSDSGMSYCSTTNTGSSWTTPTGATALQYYVYGTYTTQ